MVGRAALASVGAAEGSFETDPDGVNGQAQPAHPDAIAIDAAKPFHKQSSFIRFRPYRAEGSLGGLNPLVADALSATS